MKITVSQLRHIIAEEIAAVKDSDRFLHGGEAGQPFDDEAYMIKSQMLSIKQMASQVCDMLESGDQLPAWLQSHVAVAHENLRQAHGYLMGDAVLDSAPKEPHFMNESYSRITQEEMSAWMKGDWGFVSDLKESNFSDDDETSSDLHESEE
jgi:hypothetical protein